MEDAIAIIMIFSIPMTIIFTRFYLRLQELKLKNGINPSGGNDIRKEIGNLMAENEDLKERVKNLEYILTDEKRRISLEYEKEQILIDKQEKF